MPRDQKLDIEEIGQKDQAFMAWLGFITQLLVMETEKLRKATVVTGCISNKA